MTSDSVPISRAARDSDHHAPQPFKTGLRQIARANRTARDETSRARVTGAGQSASRPCASPGGLPAAGLPLGAAHDPLSAIRHISLETLNLQGMKALWGRKVSDLGFASLSRHPAPRRCQTGDSGASYRPLVSLDQTVFVPVDTSTITSRCEIAFGPVRACQHDARPRTQCRDQYHRGRGIFLWRTSSQTGSGQLDG